MKKLNNVFYTHHAPKGDQPELRNKTDVKSRCSGSAIMKKSFAGGRIIVGGNSAASLASRPNKMLLADEVDRYPASASIARNE